MSALVQRRPLEELLAELAGGLGACVVSCDADHHYAALAPLSVSFDLPIEFAIASSSAGLVVQTDVPRLETRTFFDLPISRLKLSLTAVRPS